MCNCLLVSIRLLTSMMLCHSNVVLCGDLNVPIIICVQHPVLKKLLLCVILLLVHDYQSVSSPAHGNSILDLVFANCSNFFNQLKLLMAFLVLIIQLFSLIFQWIFVNHILMIVPCIILDGLISAIMNLFLNMCLCIWYWWYWNVMDNVERFVSLCCWTRYSQA